MADDAHFYKIDIGKACRQLYESQILRLERNGVTRADFDLIWEEIAGTHASGRKPQGARKQINTDDEGRPEYCVNLFQIRIRYAVDEQNSEIIINRVEPPAWERA